MSIDTLKTSDNNISVPQSSKSEKTCYSLYKIAKWVITAAFWVSPPQPTTRPLERLSALEVPSTSVLSSTPKNTSSEDGLKLTLSREESRALRAKRLIEKALKSKVIVALYKEASAVQTPFHKSGPWNITFTGALDFGAKCLPLKREIALDSRLSDDEALSGLIFELVNAVHVPRFAEFDQMAKENEISREGYAFNYERIEYDTLCLHRRILSAAITEVGWGPHLLSIDHTNPHKDISFKEYLKANDKGHTDAYRRQWERLRASTQPKIRSF